MNYAGTYENLKVLKPDRKVTHRYIHLRAQFTHSGIVLIDRETARFFCSANNIYKHKHFNYGTAYQNRKSGT